MGACIIVDISIATNADSVKKFARRNIAIALPESMCLTDVQANVKCANPLLPSNFQVVFFIIRRKLFLKS